MLMYIFDYGVNIFYLLERFVEFIFDNPEIVASIVALSVSGGVGYYLRPLFGLRPKLVALDKISKIPQNEMDYWRLVVTNNGNQVAKSVQGELTCILGSNGKIKKDFFPIPLIWTHYKDDQCSRTILPSQTAYLDILMCNKNISSLNKKFTVRSLVASGVKSLEEVCVGETLVLTIFAENHDPIRREIIIED